MTSIEYRSRQTRLTERRQLLTQLYDRSDMRPYRSAIQICLDHLNQELRQLYAEASIAGLQPVTA